MRIGKIIRIIKNVPKPIIIKNWPKPQSIPVPNWIKQPERVIVR